MLEEAEDNLSRSFVRAVAKVRDLVITVGQSTINTKLFPGSPRRRLSTSSNNAIHQIAAMLILSLSPTAMVTKCPNPLGIEID
jgi:hypothetical protein